MASSAAITSASFLPRRSAIPLLSHHAVAVRGMVVLELPDDVQGAEEPPRRIRASYRSIRIERAPSARERATRFSPADATGAGKVLQLVGDGAEQV